MEVEYAQGRLRVAHDQRITDDELIRAVGKDKRFHAYLTPPAGWQPPGGHAEAVDTSGADFAVVGKPGADVDLDKLLVHDKVTVVDFSAEWCEPCKKLTKRLVDLARSENRLAIRQIDIVDWESPAAKHWLKDVAKLPCLRIYGIDGKQISVLDGDKTDGAETLLRDALHKPR